MERLSRPVVDFYSHRTCQLPLSSCLLLKAIVTRDRYFIKQRKPTFHSSPLLVFICVLHAIIPPLVTVLISTITSDCHCYKVLDTVWPTNREQIDARFSPRFQCLSDPLFPSLQPCKHQIIVSFSEDLFITPCN